MDTPTTTDKLLNTAEAANYLGLSKFTLERWRSTGRYALPYIKVGSRVRYPLNDLKTWVRRRGTLTHTP
jgi:excisionase family DNA binding protein